MRTFSQKPAEVNRDWYIIDAKGRTLGRVATEVARALVGKHKPTYTPHIDGGDHVIVTNARYIRVSGNKTSQKRYYRHSGYPGNLKSKTLQQQLADNPEAVIEHAVSGMLDENKLKQQRLRRLRVYPDAEHPHQPQQPQMLGVEDG